MNNVHKAEKREGLGWEKGQEAYTYTKKLAAMDFWEVDYECILSSLICCIFYCFSKSKKKKKS